MTTRTFGQTIRVSRTVIVASDGRGWAQTPVGQAHIAIEDHLSVEEFRGPRGGRYVPAGPIRMAQRTEGLYGDVEVITGRRETRYVRPKR